MTCPPGRNPYAPRPQPLCTQAATLCISGCNPVHSGCNPMHLSPWRCACRASGVCQSNQCIRVSRRVTRPSRVARPRRRSPHSRGWPARVRVRVRVGVRIRVRVRVRVGVGVGVKVPSSRLAWSRLSRASGLGPRPEEGGRPKPASDPSELSRDRERACLPDPDEPSDLDAEISSPVEMLISSSTDSIE